MPTPIKLPKHASLPSLPKPVELDIKEGENGCKKKRRHKKRAKKRRKNP